MDVSAPAAAPPPNPNPVVPVSSAALLPERRETNRVTQKSRREGDEAKPQWELRLQPSRQPQASLPVPVCPGHVRVRV